jgi:hypothetical protein
MEMKGGGMRLKNFWDGFLGLKLYRLMLTFIFTAFSFISLIFPNITLAQDSNASAEIQVTYPLTKLKAKDIILPKIELIWEKVDQRRGLRAHQYEKLLPAGTLIKSASLSDQESSATMTCDNDCWLFFIDEAPGAHFEHPVRIIVVDVETGAQKEVSSNMWPVIAPPGEQEKPIFNTFLKRKNTETIILEKHAILGPSSELVPEFQKTPPIDQILPFVVDEDCDTWAIIVCGYNDLPDTFDEDTNGIYSVLKGLGIPDNHIFYLSPHTSHAGVDRATTYPNVQWAINEVAARSGSKDKVLFLYSSHGGVDGLSCVPDISPPGEKSISSSNLDNWLDTIICDELTIIIEACHSGSFIGMYADGTYVSSEDELTGEGETNRAIFTSASTDTSSYPDRDDAGDPNPADLGSETIWGYIEAFSIPAADTNIDGAISFGEAFQYAWDNDVTRILGWNTPQMAHTGLNTAEVFHHCFPVCDCNGPYEINCEDNITQIMLDGSASNDPAPCEAFAYSWTTDCPGASFDDPTSSTPLLYNLNPEDGCLECNVTLTVSCLDGSWEDCSAPVAIKDTSPPLLTIPDDIEIECDQSTGPGNTGQATASDNCDSDPTVKYTDNLDQEVCQNEFTITRTWTATDSCGNSTSGTQIITVKDTTPPSIDSNAPDTIVPPDAPISFTATVYDNCDDSPSVIITGYDCYKFTKKGKRINKTESCVVDISGDQITIHDSGGVNDQIVWTIEASDECGNTSTINHEVIVVNPGKNK